MADLMDEAIEISHKLIPCNICGRTFLPSPLKKHAKVCEKNATRKRKTFNSLKQRIEGTELAVFHQKSYLRKNSETNCQSVGVVAATAAAAVVTAPSHNINEEKKNQSKWKEKHEQLVQAIRAAKGEKVMAPRRSISAVGSMGTTEQCPTCDRHFGPKAYDRHVEWCKEHKIRASKSPAIVTIAKERLEARTKYRVPPLNKSKRSVTREKYASPSGRSSNHHHHHQENVIMNVRSTSSLEQSSRKTKQKQSQNCPPLSEPVIKQQQQQQQQHHNAEKLKSSNFKYRVYPILKMNDTHINDSVLDMTVSQMNLLTTSTCRPPSSSSTTTTTSCMSSKIANHKKDTIKLITWKEQQQQQQQQQRNEQNEQLILATSDVSKNLPFTVNLVDSEQNLQNNNINNIIEYNDLDIIPEEEILIEQEEEDGYGDVLPTIIEEEDSENVVTIKEAISASKMCESDEEPSQFRSSTPVAQLNPIETEDESNSIRIRNETENSISFDISPILYETPVAIEPRVTSFTFAEENDERLRTPQTKRSNASTNTNQVRSQNKEGLLSEHEWQDLDEVTAAPSENEESSEGYNYNYKKTKILDKFLKKKKRDNCRLEVEIIANETQPPGTRKKFHLYRVNSSEIVIRGDRCIDALNKSFTRNKIKHVNIVFVNEVTNDESEIMLQTDLNAKTYNRDTFVINTDNQRKSKKKKKLRRQKNVMNKLADAKKCDNFWAQYTTTQNDCNHFMTTTDVDDDDDDYDELTLPPINIKKKQKCERSNSNEPPTRFPPIHESLNQKEKDDYDPFIIAEKQLMELLQGDDFKPYNKLKSLPHPPSSSKSSNNTKKHSLDTTQKHKLDNFELIENIINDNEINSIDPKLINEIDGLKIPDQLLIDNYSYVLNNSDDVDDYSAQYDKNISLLEPLVLPKTEMKRSSSRLTDADFEEFISSFDDDDGFPMNVTPDANKQTKKKCLNNYSFGRNAMINKKHPLSPLKRSVSLSNPVVKARSMKNKQDIQDYLHVREPKQQQKVVANCSPRSSDELFPVGHDMYDEYKKYEEMYRREQDDNDESSNEDSTPPPQQHAPTSKQHERNYSTAADSAYGSLNRKSPKIQPKSQHSKRSPSSSGSETCTSLPKNRLTKFCHECGTKYPLDSAKFCVECGIKRLVL